MPADQTDPGEHHDDPLHHLCVPCCRPLLRRGVLPVKKIMDRENDDVFPPTTMEKPFDELAHGWLQWKGTEACIDLHCECGEHWHEDAMFLYFVSCPKCGKRYALNGHLRLEPVAATLETTGEEGRTS